MKQTSEYSTFTSILYSIVLNKGLKKYLKNRLLFHCHFIGLCYEAIYISINSLCGIFWEKTYLECKNADEQDRRNPGEFGHHITTCSDFQAFHRLCISFITKMFPFHCFAFDLE